MFIARMGNNAIDRKKHSAQNHFIFTVFTMFSKKSEKQPILKYTPLENAYQNAYIKATNYIETGHYEKAMKVYDSIPGWETDKRILINLAYISMQMKRNEAAIYILQTINGWEEDINILINLTHCYEALGQFDKALQFNSYILNNWWHEKAFIRLALCYQKMGLYLTAIHTFGQIPNWEKNKRALLGLARCYQKMGDYTASINTFVSIPDWEIDKEALLGLAHCYAQSGQDAKANQCYHAKLSLNHAYQKKTKALPPFISKQNPSDVALLNLNNTSPLKLVYFEEMVCLLWAIQWMVLGYPIIPSVENLLYNWHLNPLIEASEVRAVIKMQHAYLNHEQRLDYFKLFKHYGLESKLNTQEPPPSHHKKNAPHTFFKYYNPTTRKGLSACTMEKSTLLFTTDSETDAYLIKHYKQLPHLEALDLSAYKI